jgi:hypothetical protein
VAHALKAVQDLLAERGAAFDRVRHRERMAAAVGLAWLPIVLFAVAATVDGWLPMPWWSTLGIGLIGLLVIVLLRERLTARRRRLGHAVTWHEHRRDRLLDLWSFGQEDGAAYDVATHPYTRDLDVFGPGSMFSRTNGAATALGRDALARLLQGHALPADFPERRDTVAALVADLPLRERLAVEAGELRLRRGRTPIEREARDARTRDLLGWGAIPSPPPDPAWQIALDIFLGVAFTMAFAACVLGHLPWTLLLPLYLVNYLRLGSTKDVEKDLEHFEGILDTIGPWSRLMACVEESANTGPLVADARARLVADRGTASSALAALERRVERLARRENLFWALSFDVAWVYDRHARRALHAWKRRFGTSVDTWLLATAEVEAWSSLALYAEAVPDQATATVDVGGPALAATDLAHPLVSRAKRVGNDVAMQDPGALVLITGSNMSGKSTFLRAIGLAVVLGRLGVPVPARSLHMRPLTVTTCMRVQDDLAQGASLFQAEVRRLRACLDHARSSPLTLILLDEILAGTNSRERHLGTESVLEELTRLPALTMVATHDLDLVDLLDRTPGRGQVVHFRDLVEDGQLTFDYRLRPGVCPSTNALAVMRREGLPVPE